MFSGATASLRSPNLHFAPLRNVWRRNWGRRGVHVAHVSLDGVIRGHKHAYPGGDVHFTPRIAAIFIYTSIASHGLLGLKGLMCGLGVKSSELSDLIIEIGVNRSSIRRHFQAH